MAKITKFRGRKPLVEGEVRVGYSNFVGEGRGIRLNVLPQGEGDRFHTLVLSLEEAQRVKDKIDEYLKKYGGQL